MLPRMPLLKPDSIVAKSLAAFGLNAADIEQQVRERFKTAGTHQVIADLCDAWGVDRNELARMAREAADQKLPEFFDNFDLPVLGRRLEARIEKNRIIPAILKQIDAELSRFTRA